MNCRFAKRKYASCKLLLVKMSVQPETKFFELIPGAMRIQRFCYRQPIRFPEHCHDELSIVVCTKGAIESSQFGASTTMQPGDVLVTNRRVRHASNYLCQGGAASGITIELGLDLQKQLGLFGQLYLGCLKLERIGQIALDLEQELRDEQLHSSTMRMVLAQELVIRTVRQWPVDLLRPGLAADEDLLTRQEFVEATTAWQRALPTSESFWKDEDFERRFRNTTGLDRRSYEDKLRRGQF